MIDNRDIIYYGTELKPLFNTTAIITSIFTTILSAERSMISGRSSTWTPAGSWPGMRSMIHPFI